MYVDWCVAYPDRPGSWCHLLADSKKELNVMARSLRIPRIWFQQSGKMGIPHYDLNPQYRRLALKRGAVPLNTLEELGAILRKLREQQQESQGQSSVV